MSEFFDELLTGLNEAVAIERGELKGRKTVYENQSVKNLDAHKKNYEKYTTDID